MTLDPGHALTAPPTDQKTWGAPAPEDAPMTDRSDDQPPTITNTTREVSLDPYKTAVLAMVLGGSVFIESQERLGQTELVESTQMPTRLDEGEEAYIALGFTFGPASADDPLFRPATLPPGWKKVGSDHAMWSYIQDETGAKRVAVFYKAAFYDRDAFARLEYRFTTEWLNQSESAKAPEKERWGVVDRKTKAVLFEGPQGEDSYHVCSEWRQANIPRRSAMEEWAAD